MPLTEIYDTTAIPSDTGSLGTLYVDHEIDEDMVIGPVEIWKPKLTLIIGTETKPEEPVKTIEKIAEPCKILCTERTQNDICKFKNAQKHMHSNVRSYSCDVCHKTYKRETTLLNHKHIHKNIKPYKCKHCMKSFTFKGQLQTHLRLHTGEKPYKCDVCDKEFTQQTTLNNHVLKHKGIKPYVCEFCKEQFRQVSNLKQHLEVKHSDEKNTPEDGNSKKIIDKEGVVWYECKKCKVMFSNNEDLSKHMKLMNHGDNYP